MKLHVIAMLVSASLGMIAKPKEDEEPSNIEELGREARNLYSQGNDIALVLEWPYEYELSVHTPELAPLGSLLIASCMHRTRHADHSREGTLRWSKPDDFIPNEVREQFENGWGQETHYDIGAFVTPAEPMGCLEEVSRCSWWPDAHGGPMLLLPNIHRGCIVSANSEFITVNVNGIEYKSSRSLWQSVTK